MDPMAGKHPLNAASPEASFNDNESILSASSLSDEYSYAGGLPYPDDPELINAMLGEGEEPLPIINYDPVPEPLSGEILIPIEGTHSDEASGSASSKFDSLQATWDSEEVGIECVPWLSEFYQTKYTLRPRHLQHGRAQNACAPVDKDESGDYVFVSDEEGHVTSDQDKSPRRKKKKPKKVLTIKTGKVVGDKLKVTTLHKPEAVSDEVKVTTLCKPGSVSDSSPSSESFIESPQSAISEFYKEDISSNTSEVSNVSKVSKTATHGSNSSISSIRSAPVDVFGNVGKIRALRSCFAHPIKLNHKVISGVRGGDCHWCRNVSFGLFGYGVAYPTIIDFGHGRPYIEESGGHATKHSSSRMCDSCTLLRVSIMTCPSHNFLPLEGLDPFKFDFKAAYNTLTAKRGLDEDSIRWCSLCATAAFFECSKHHKDFGPGNLRCGLALCFNCKLVLSGKFANDLQKMLRVCSSDIRLRFQLFPHGMRADCSMLRADDKGEVYRQLG